MTDILTLSLVAYALSSYLKNFILATRKADTSMIPRIIEKFRFIHRTRDRGSKTLERINAFLKSRIAIYLCLTEEDEIFCTAFFKIRLSMVTIAEGIDLKSKIVIDPYLIVNN